jgi:DNA-binding transcriptional regulator YbjK
VKAVTRERNPRGQGDRLRVDLLEAAVELIAETGSVQGVSLRAAAKRAGV